MFLILTIMTTKQFKTKLKYWCPFVMAWWFEVNHFRYYHVSYVLDDGSKLFTFQQSPCFSPSNVKSVLFTLVDSDCYQSQMRFLKDFLLSCKPSQLDYFIHESYFFSVNRLLHSAFSSYVLFLKNLIGSDKFQKSIFITY